MITEQGSGIYIVTPFSYNACFQMIPVRFFSPPNHPKEAYSIDWWLSSLYQSSPQKIKGKWFRYAPPITPCAVWFLFLFLRRLFCDGWSRGVYVDFWLRRIDGIRAKPQSNTGGRGFFFIFLFHFK